MKRAIFSSDAAVQTEALPLTLSSTRDVHDGRTDFHDAQESSLSATDLASILKWSKDISRDINLSSGNDVCLLFHFKQHSVSQTALQRLTEIVTGIFVHDQKIF